jgi:hypothetical protein
MVKQPSISVLLETKFTSLEILTTVILPEHLSQALALQAALHFFTLPHVLPSWQLHTQILQWLLQ